MTATNEAPEWKVAALGKAPTFGIQDSRSILEQRQSLPIYKLKDQLVQAVLDNQVWVHDMLWGCLLLYCVTLVGRDLARGLCAFCSLLPCLLASLPVCLLVCMSTVLCLAASCICYASEVNAACAQVLDFSVHLGASKYLGRVVCCTPTTYVSAQQQLPGFLAMNPALCCDV
eukprot:GHUV01039707.1.p1 GENE.GHUV01039707.1~~GHUV01039707.1.p1  ORF type:complete len:188 (-),score=34.95 GHUV01039707.1:269-784(-)